MDIKTLLNQCKNASFPGGKKITILGAGIAGLVAAYELEKLGHQVDVMEGSPRIGGRIWTHRFGQNENAPYGEFGAMRIPSTHEYVLHYVHALELSDKLRKFVTLFEERNAFLHINETIVRIKDMATQSLQSPHQGLFLDKRYNPKTRLFAAWLKTIVDAIGSGELREDLQRDLNSHLMDTLETINLEPFFSKDGQNIDLHTFFKTYPSVQRQCTQSLGLFLDDILVETDHNLLQLEGGLDQLIHQLADRLTNPIKCNQEVVALRVGDDHVKVSWLEDCKLNTRNCDYVLCTIPFSILQKMELYGFDEEKLDTIHKTIYWPATKVLFHCSQPFWQQSGIFGGASFSDEGIRQIYYPSLNGNGLEGSVLLASYTIGSDAGLLGAMPDQHRIKHVKTVLSKLHPQLKEPGILMDTASIAWGNYKWSSGGCALPWNHGRSYDDRNIPNTARPQNTLFFAGEHCSRFPAWIQGSIESSLEAVYGILTHMSCSDLKLQSLASSNITFV